ncbi:MAG: hypothetical protein H6841_09135 [Planctomycetes bacterium]|nr:hypothetical protein [Planctomycetota bacterium]MCB9934887.1 hypothetical protein [Planctomycetota bacterium]
MRVPFSRCLPALVAALLLALLPSCASLPDDLMTAAVAEAHERTRPVINRELKPVADGAPTCIQRGAGAEFDPPDLDVSGGEAWGYVMMAVAWVVVFIGYTIGWCFYKVGELIWEACDTPSLPEEELPADPPDE